MSASARDSWLHRLPVGVKLLTLSLSAVALIWARSPALLLMALALIAVLTLSARIPGRALWQQLRPALWVAAIALPLNWLFSGWESALLISGRLFAALALAGLFTLSTTTTAVLASTERWFGRMFGPARAERIGLMIALTIRSLPLLAELVHEVNEARRARGLERSVRALVVPVLVRALKSADELGEALLARGLGDDADSQPLSTIQA